MNSNKIYIGIIIKIISCIFIFISMRYDYDIFADDVVIVAFLLSISIESTILISSISPLAIYSVVYASILINEKNYYILALGYFGALSGNLLSYAIGRVFHGSRAGDTNFLMKTVLTYWHPQLASLTAFDAGVSGEEFGKFLRAAVPVSITYYMTALSIIMLVGNATKLQISEEWLIGAIGVWVLWDIWSLRRN